MTAEQKERARHEVEVEKARQLKRIADALEVVSAYIKAKSCIALIANKEDLNNG